MALKVVVAVFCHQGDSLVDQINSLSVSYSCATVAPASCREHLSFIQRAKVLKTMLSLHL